MATDREAVSGHIPLIHAAASIFTQSSSLHNVTVYAEPGQKVAFVGATGAGKTTIANLIARLYDAKEGSVKIDGIDVRDLRLTELRRNIGLVSQDIYLFSGTIADNIRYAKPDATMSEIIAAAKAASAHDFIMKLPDAYETRVGAGGQKLSGGERQRVALAMILAQNTPIALLDEPTAHMDQSQEAAFLQRLTELKQTRKKTFLVVLHDLTLAARYADDLIVLEEGKLIFSGTKEDCLQQEILEETFSLRRYTFEEVGEKQIFFAAK